MRVTVADPVRVLRGGSLCVEDFTDIAGCASVDWGADGALVVDFDGNLTTEQQLRVRIRCISRDPAEEAVLIATAQAYFANLDYLAQPPTADRAIAQVQALTQQMNGVLRFITRL